MSLNPLVSMVMPTYNRARYIPSALRCFFQQLYPKTELIIVDDSTEPSENFSDVGLANLINYGHALITYIKLDKRTPTGTKRNMGAETADGEIIANLDDDDWSSAHRLEDQVNRLMKTGKAVTGYNATVLFDEASQTFCLNPGGPPYFASGTSQCYWKDWWKQHPYPDCSFGEDSVFSRVARLADQLAIAPPGRMMVARKHSNNTCGYGISHLPKVHNRDIPKDFFETVLQDLGPDYILKRHDCDGWCREEVRKQLDAPIIEYRIENLPEVETR